MTKQEYELITNSFKDVSDSLSDIAKALYSLRDLLYEHGPEILLTGSGRLSDAICELSTTLSDALYREKDEE